LLILEKDFIKESDVLLEILLLLIPKFEVIFKFMLFNIFSFIDKLSLFVRFKNPEELLVAILT
jgi:hypothetical protein